MKAWAIRYHDGGHPETPTSYKVYPGSCKGQVEKERNQRPILLGNSQVVCVEIKEVQDLESRQS